MSLRPRDAWGGLLAVLVLVFAFAGPAARAEPTFPALTGRVVDDAHILSEATKSSLEAKLADVEAKTTNQFVVVTLPSLQGYEIADYGYQLGRKWQIGQKDKNNGVLLIVAPTEHKVRIEVGYGLEPVLTDALSSVIIQEQILPKFRAHDMEGGVVAGADAVIKQLTMDPAQAHAVAVQAASRPAHKPIAPFAIFIAIFIFIWVFGLIFGRRRGWGGPMIFYGGGGGSSGWSSGGGGGGGFSGGGGSFGGGGSSGSW